MPSQSVSQILMRRYVTELVRSPRAIKALGQNGITWRTTDQRPAVPAIPGAGTKRAVETVPAS